MTQLLASPNELLKIFELLKMKWKFNLKNQNNSRPEGPRKKRSKQPKYNKNVVFPRAEGARKFLDFFILKIHPKIWKQGQCDAALPID